MVAFERVCIERRPDWVVVVGDVNSTLACAIVAKKLCIQVAHVEAGLRSFDRTMPEEINRRVTDAVSDAFFVTEQSGVDNLLREGAPTHQVHLVGHVMIDNLLRQLRRLESGEAPSQAVADARPPKGGYVFLTLHRPSNVDRRDSFQAIMDAVNTIAEELPVVFLVHPRTRARLDQFGLSLSPNIRLLPPLGFRESLFLWKDARLVMTDSGGLQEETSALGIPCLTLRENTERPVTIDLGSNMLAGTTTASILSAYARATKGGPRSFSIPPLWDGRAAERIWTILCGE
jgi:UDP-N-acetylglucosamine 2-epimerase (non-hydrolysing)